MKKNNQSGFHAIWLVLVLVGAVIGGAGVYIYSKNNKKADTIRSNGANNTETQSSTDTPFGIDYTVYKPNDNQNPGFEENDTNTKVVREIVAYVRGKNCITDTLTGRVIGEQTEAQFISKLVVDDSQKRAFIICNSQSYIGRTASGSWEQIYDMGQMSKISTVVAEACGLTNILNKLAPFAVKGDTLSKLTLDDGYYGGAGTANYTEATSAAVKACNDFVAING